MLQERTLEAASAWRLLYGVLHDDGLPAAARLHLLHVEVERVALELLDGAALVVRHVGVGGHHQPHHAQQLAHRL